MKPLTGLYKPIPFLLKYPVLHEKYFIDRDQKLELRPVSIMQDISVIYTWINKPRLLGSGHIKTYQRNMLKYYKTILESSESQCFMVLENGIQACQFDVLPASADSLHSKLATTSNDVTLRYIAEFRINTRLFQSCLYICLDYIFSLLHDAKVFISLPASVHVSGDDLMQVGCHPVESFYEQEEMIKVYRCIRPDLRIP